MTKPNMHIILSSIQTVNLGTSKKGIPLRYKTNLEFTHPPNACPLYDTDPEGNLTDVDLSFSTQIMSKRAFVPDVDHSDIFMFLLSGLDVEVILPQYIKCQMGKYGLLRAWATSPAGPKRPWVSYRKFIKPKIRSG